MSSSWAPVDLEAVMDDPERATEQPSLLYRSDGVALMYPNKQHSAYGEPESCKSFFAAKAIAHELLAGMSVVLIDFEDDAPTWIERLTALGTPADRIRRCFHYVRPAEPIGECGADDLEPFVTKASLVVIDGTNEGMALHGWNLADNSDVAQWMQLLRRWQSYGAAVLAIDHVTKDRESRGRYAIGGQAKLATVDVAYSMKVIKPFGRGRDGLVAIKVEKDRPGYVRAHQGDNGQIALMRLTSEAGGGVTITLDPPEGAGASFRPTVLMERISRAIEESPGLTKRAVRQAVVGNSSAKDLGLELLVAEGFVEVDPSGAGHAHYSTRPFREGVTTERDHRDPACPSGDQSVPGTRDHRDPPSLEAGTGHTTPKNTTSLTASVVGEGASA